MKTFLKGVRRPGGKTVEVEHVGSSLLFIEKPFVFDDADLVSGKTVYTFPRDGYLIDATFQIDAPWNGTTPKGDLGYVGQDYGWWNSLGNPTSVDMTREWGDYWSDGKTLTGTYAFSLSSAQILASVFSEAPGPGQSLPIKHVAGTELIVWVTQSGNRNGDDPGATQGSGLVLVTIGFPSS